jgi:hypothetical protein
MGIQEQATGLLKVREDGLASWKKLTIVPQSPQEARKEDQERDQARHPRHRHRRPLRAIRLDTEHPICILQGDGQDSG